MVFIRGRAAVSGLYLFIESNSQIKTPAVASDCKGLSNSINYSIISKALCIKERKNHCGSQQRELQTLFKIEPRPINRQKK